MQINKLGKSLAEKVFCFFFLVVNTLAEIAQQKEGENPSLITTECIFVLFCISSWLFHLVCSSSFNCTNLAKFMTVNFGCCTPNIRSCHTLWCGGEVGVALFTCTPGQTQFAISVWSGLYSFLFPCNSISQQSAKKHFQLCFLLPRNQQWLSSTECQVLCL